MTLGKHSSNVCFRHQCRLLTIFSYALHELQKDVEEELLTRPVEEREKLRAATQFGVFVVHNKLKPKLAELPAGTPLVSLPIRSIPTDQPRDTGRVRTSGTYGE